MKVSIFGKFFLGKSFDTVFNKGQDHSWIHDFNHTLSKNSKDEDNKSVMSYPMACEDLKGNRTPLVWNEDL